MDKVASKVVAWAPPDCVVHQILLNLVLVAGGLRIQTVQWVLG